MSEIQERAAHDPDHPQALVDFMSTGWLHQAPVRRAHPEIARFESRREELCTEFPGEYLLIAAGTEHVRANDTNFRFRPDSDFAYLMGSGAPDELLVLEPDGTRHRSRLFTAAHNRGTAAFFTDRVRGELWVGRHRGLEESQAYYGVDTVSPLEEAEAYLHEIHDSTASVRILGEDEELGRALAEMRLIKDEYEVAELRKAVEITKRGFEDAIRAMRAGRGERAIEAAFWARARIEANDVGYLTIAAAGEHACTLHWNRNTGLLEAGTLLLLDAGVECNSLYTADVTRTLPISGHFTREQRAVYELVWEAQRAGMAAVVPGNDFLEPHRRAMHVLAEGLIDLGVLSCSLDEALDPERQLYRRYTLHGVSHMLGIDVHDCARARSERYRYGSLREGMALTVEPGLYFQPDDATVPEEFRGIGVRIEDDLVVTASGSENLSAILPSRIDDVEHWIAQLHG